jgi:hypothetical protein
MDSKLSAEQSLFSLSLPEPVRTHRGLGGPSPPGGADFVVENMHGWRLFDTGRTVKKKTEAASGDPTAQAWGKWLRFEPQMARLKTDPTAQSRSVRQNAGSEGAAIPCAHPRRLATAPTWEPVDAFARTPDRKALPSHAPKSRRLATAPTWEPVDAFARTPDQERCCHPMRPSPAVWRRRLHGAMHGALRTRRPTLLPS